MTAISAPRWPILLASCVLVVGLSFVWVGPEPLWSARCLQQSSTTGPEPTGFSYGVALWPPGTECKYTFSDGTQKRSTYVPWAEWLAVAVLAAAAAAASRVIRKGARPSWRLAAAIGVCTIALGALFAGPAIGPILLLLAITAAIGARLRHANLTAPNA